MSTTEDRRRSQKIYTLNCLGFTFDEIGKLYNISRQRAHQVVVRERQRRDEAIEEYVTVTAEVAEEWYV